MDFSILYPVNKQLITKRLQNCTNAMSYLKECSISETERMWIHTSNHGKSDRNCREHHLLYL